MLSKAKPALHAVQEAVVNPSPLQAVQVAAPEQVLQDLGQAFAAPASK